MRVFPVLFFALLAGGCMHVATKVPGTLDLRSDGSAATVEKKALNLDSPHSRIGTERLIYGDGIREDSPGKLDIVERQYWVFRLFPIIDERSTEKRISIALGKSAIRKAHIGDGISPINVAATLVLMLLPVGQLPIIMPPMDRTFSGERISVGDSATTEFPLGETTAAPAEY